MVIDDVDHSGADSVVGAVVQQPRANVLARVLEVLGQDVGELAQRRHLAHPEHPVRHMQAMYVCRVGSCATSRITCIQIIIHTPTDGGHAGSKIMTDVYTHQSKNKIKISDIQNLNTCMYLYMNINRSSYSGSDVTTHTQ